MSNKELFSGGFGAKLTDFQRGYAKALYDLGQTAAQMAERMKFSKQTADNMINLDFQYDQKMKKTPKYSEQDKQKIIKISQNNRDLSAAQISKDELLNPKVISARQIQRILNDHGLKPRRKKIMQEFTEKKRKERLKIAKIYVKFSQTKMRRIFFSDESNICLSLNGIQLVRKYDFEQLNNEQFRKLSKTKPLYQYLDVNFI